MSEQLLPEASGVNAPSTPAEPIPTPTLRPVADAPEDASPPASEGAGASAAPKSGPTLGPDGLPRPRRRRGSRGGRNRKRPTGPRPAAGTDAPANDAFDDADASDDADVDGSIETAGVEAVAPKAGTGR